MGKSPVEPGGLPIQSKPIPSEAIPYRWSNPGRPARWLLSGPYSALLHFRRTELAEFYTTPAPGRDDAQRMVDHLAASIFAIHPPTRADVQM